MAPRKPPVPALRGVNRARTHDSFANAAARRGVQRGSDNLISQGTYAFDPITRNRVLLEAMYRSSWVTRRVVGVVAEDMTKAGVDYRGEAPPDELKRLRSRLTRTGSWRTLTQGLKWGRLYGGAVSMIQVRGQDPGQPLRPETAAGGGFQGLRVYDRWQLRPVPGYVVQDPGPEQGQPVFYEVVPYGGNNASPEALFRVHYTRLLRHEGDDLPTWQRQTEQGWGMSVMEPIYDRLISYDSTTMGAAQLVFRAHLRTMKIQGWKKNLAMGGELAEGALAEIDFVRRFQQLEGITVLDSTSDLTAQQYSFGGLDGVMTQMSTQIAGAAGIPQVKIFGQSPGGFSSGDADLQSYNDDVASRQEHDLRLGLSRLFQVVYWSENNKPPPDDFDFDFAPLKGLSEDEKATLANARTTPVMNAFTAQVIKKSTTLKELQAIGAETGVFASITDDDVQEAEDEEQAAKDAAAQQALLGGTPGDPLGGPGGPEGGDGGPPAPGGPDDVPEGFQGPSDASGGGADDGDLPDGFRGGDEDLPQGFRDAAPRRLEDITVEQLRAIFGDEVLRDAGVKTKTRDAWEEAAHPRDHGKFAGKNDAHNNIEGMQFPHSGHALSSIAEHHGFDTPARGMSKKEFDEAVKKSPYGHIIRGVSNPDWGAAHVAEGKYHTGLGVYGKGLYFASGENVEAKAKQFGDHHAHAVLHPDARVGDYEDVNKEYEDWRKNYEATHGFSAIMKRYENGEIDGQQAQAIHERASKMLANINDPTTYAAMAGYDAVHVDHARTQHKSLASSAAGSNEMIVLNRGALGVRRDGTKDAWEPTKHPRGNSKNAGQFSSTPGGAKTKKESVGAQKLKALGVGHDHLLVAGTSNTKKYDAYKTVKDYVDAHPKGKETALRILAMDYLSGHIKFKHPTSGAMVHSGNVPGKAGKAAPPEAKAKAEPEPKPKGTPEKPTDATGWKKVGDKKGSNAGGTYEDESGQQHYIKETKSSDHQRSELLAEALYQKLGVATLERTAHQLDGKPAVGAPLAKLKRFDPYDPAHRAEAQRDFVAHAFLGNWDAVGQSFDNLAFKDGKLAQVDAGGSLRYRAQGGIKSFTSSVGELDSLRSSVTSPQGHQVFGGMTPEQIKQSAEPVLKLSDKDIHDLAGKFIEDSSDAKEMAEKLIGRREDIRKRVAALTAPKPPIAPLHHDDHERWAKAGGVKSWVGYGHSINLKEFSELHGAFEHAGLTLHKAADNSTVKSYVGSGHYSLNASLRSGNTSDNEPMVKAMDKIVNGSKFKEDTIMYRGFGSQATTQLKAPPPTEFQDDGYSSVSFNPGVSKGFGTQQSLYRVRIPKGFPGAAFARGDRDVGDMLRDEAEVVLPRGTIYKIVKRTPNAAYGGTHDIVDVVAYHPSMG